MTNDGVIYALSAQIAQLERQVLKLEARVHSLDGSVAALKNAAWPQAAERRAEYLRRYQAGEPVKAIAAACGVSVSRVHSAIAKARREA
jgi:DNA-directed RNA polymerase specialized sigma24 family protein